MFREHHLDEEHLSDQEIDRLVDDLMDERLSVADIVHCKWCRHRIADRALERGADQLVEKIHGLIHDQMVPGGAMY